MNHSKRPQLLAWETTRACSMACPHCRASATPTPETNELSTQEGITLLSDAAKLGSWIIILSGGEPLLRPDLEKLAKHGTSLGHIVTVACNDARLLTPERAKSLKEAGVSRFSFSVHFPEEHEYDRFTGRFEAWKQALKAFKLLRELDIPFQVNTTVLPGNKDRLEQILDLVKYWGAVAWHLFFIVPTGRAAEQPASLSPQESEEALTWIAQNSEMAGIPIKVTCAPQYARVRAQLGLKNLPGPGCMAGNGFVFISSTGDVRPCGYFEETVGNIRQKAFDDLYQTAPLFQTLRQPGHLEGACGACSFQQLCQGCRARALAKTGNSQSSDPMCLHAVTGDAPHGFSPTS